MAKGRVRKTDHYRIFYINRPNLPQIEKYVDTELEAIFINIAAKPGGKIVYLKNND